MLANADMGRFLKCTEIPVYKVKGDTPRSKYHEEDLLFDIKNDYAQQEPLTDKEIEEHMKKLMVREMKEADTPDEQFLRLGLEDIVEE